SPSHTPTPTPTPEPEPVAVEFEISGDGPLPTLIYAVNGRPTTLENVNLPWRETAEAPRETGSVAWSLDFTHYGEVTYRVVVDGRESQERQSPDPNVPPSYLSGGPYGVEAGGETALAESPAGTSA
ncbi:hypothetical protein, partial [Streptomyces sp. URMC 129]|uniref:hypothetical protein n=1 Tax=Streptomyces sp. URMC 129 TaxID=3423407 RepID=UPI003F1BA28E